MIVAKVVVVWVVVAAAAAAVVVVVVEVVVVVVVVVAVNWAQVFPGGSTHTFEGQQWLPWSGSRWCGGERPGHPWSWRPPRRG